jgi:hypothetical protein
MQLEFIWNNVKTKITRENAGKTESDIKNFMAHNFETILGTLEKCVLKC